MMNHFASHGINQPNKFNGYRDIALAVIELAIKDLDLQSGPERKSAVKFFKHDKHKLYCEVANIDYIMVKEKAFKKIGEYKNDGNNSNNQPA